MSESARQRCIVVAGGSGGATSLQPVRGDDQVQLANRNTIVEQDKRDIFARRVEPCVLCQVNLGAPTALAEPIDLPSRQCRSVKLASLGWKWLKARAPGGALVSRRIVHTSDSVSSKASTP